MSKKTPKTRVGFYIETELLAKCDACLKAANASSRNEFVNEAIRAHIGRWQAEDSQQYLAGYLVSAIAGAVGDSENRIARLLFKFSVELSMLTQVLAAMTDVDESTLHRLRAKCVEEVRRSNGAINLERTAKEQKGNR